MSITFTITNQPAAIPGQEMSHTFSQGGTLGRTRTCDWVLIDASRFISGKHAVISEQNGVFQITDTSTNGVFINQSKTPLGKGNSAVLNNGDVLKIGEYAIKVSITGAQPSAGPSPLDQSAYTPPESFAPPGDKIVDSGLEKEQVDVLNLFKEPQKAEKETPLTPPPEPGPGPGPIEDFISGAEKKAQYKGTQGSNAPSVQSNFTPPNLIPDNWREEEKSSLKPPQDFKPTSHPPTPGEEQQPPASGIDLKQPAKIPEVIPVVKEKVGPASAGYAAGSEAVQAFLKGLGLEDCGIPPEQIPAFMHSAGEVLRESISGAYNVLRSRTNIKSEFRMSMTTIQAAENNPLKFSVNAQEAIRNMFLNAGNSYLPPVEAIREGFEDIESHQLAVMAGTQAAITALLQRFEPEFLEQTFDRTISRAGLLSGGKKAKYWEAYEEYFKNLASSVEDNFQNMFGEEFARAYENQVNRLIGSRRRK